jgi:hypothetical protein
MPVCLVFHVHTHAHTHTCPLPCVLLRSLRRPLLTMMTMLLGQALPCLANDDAQLTTAAACLFMWRGRDEDVMSLSKCYVTKPSGAKQQQQAFAASCSASDYGGRSAAPKERKRQAIYTDTQRKQRAISNHLQK